MQARQHSSQRSAFTLVEIVVVLVLMGAALAIVAPSFILPPPESGLKQVLTAGRRTALRRGQAMTFSLKPDGSWRLAEERPKSDRFLAGGKIDSEIPSDAEIGISPVGVCTVQRGHLGGPDDHLDPLTCVVASHVRSGR